MSDDDVWIVTVPNYKIAIMERDYSKRISSMPKDTTVTVERKFYFDTRKQAKKFCLENDYPLDYISVNEDQIGCFMNTDDVWIVTIPAEAKIEECIALARDDELVKEIRNNPYLQEDDIICFDSRREAKKYCLTHHYPLDYISVNED